MEAKIGDLAIDLLFFSIQISALQLIFKHVSL
jgi:hypothetical protein